jgi:hypothetical protein
VLPRLAIAALTLAGCHVVFPLHKPGDSASAVEAGTVEAGTVDRSIGDQTAEALSPSDDVSPAADLPQGWCSSLSSWRYRKTLAIQKVQQDLPDFPLLVSFQDVGLGARARTDGKDLRFCSADGTMVLAHEVELYQAPAGEVVAWVKVPKLLSGGMTIYIYYGNPAAALSPDPRAVWKNGYLGVWHLHTQPPTVTESVNGYPTTSYAAVQYPTPAPGKIGKAHRFDGVDDKLFSKEPALKPTGALTVSAWFRLDGKDTDVDDDDLVTASGNTGDRSWDLSFDIDPTYAPCHAVSFRTTSAARAGVAAGWTKVCPGVWHHVVGVFKPGAAIQLYLDGQLDDEKTQSVASALYFSTVHLHIGAETGDYSGWSHFMGEIDEVRIAGVARSPAWIAATHANQDSPGSFVTVGPQQSAW